MNKEEEIKSLIGEACVKLCKGIQGTEKLHDITLHNFEWDVVLNGRVYKIYFEEIINFEERRK